MPTSSNPDSHTHFLSSLSHTLLYVSSFSSGLPFLHNTQDVESSHVSHSSIHSSQTGSVSVPELNFPSGHLLQSYGSPPLQGPLIQFVLQGLQSLVDSSRYSLSLHGSLHSP